MHAFPSRRRPCNASSALAWSGVTRRAHAGCNAQARERIASHCSEQRPSSEVFGKSRERSMRKRGCSTLRKSLA